MAWSLRPGQPFWPRRRRAAEALPSVPVAVVSPVPVGVPSPGPAGWNQVRPGPPLLTLAPASTMVTVRSPRGATDDPPLSPFPTDDAGAAPWGQVAGLVTVASAPFVRPAGAPVPVADVTGQSTPIRYDTAAVFRSPTRPAGRTPPDTVRPAPGGQWDLRPVGPVAHGGPLTGAGDDVVDALRSPRSTSYLPPSVPQADVSLPIGTPSPSGPTWWGGPSPVAHREPIPVDRPAQLGPDRPVAQGPAAVLGPVAAPGPTAIPGPAPEHRPTPDHSLTLGHRPALDHGLPLEHGPTPDHGLPLEHGPTPQHRPTLDHGPALEHGPSAAAGLAGGAGPAGGRGLTGGPETPGGPGSPLDSPGAAGPDAAAARTAAQFAAAGLPTAQVWPPPGFEVAYLAAEATRAADEARASAGGGGRARPGQPDTGTGRGTVTSAAGHDGRTEQGMTPPASEVRPVEVAFAGRRGRAARSATARPGPEPTSTTQQPAGAGDPHGTTAPSTGPDTAGGVGQSVRSAAQDGVDPGARSGRDDAAGSDRDSSVDRRRDGATDGGQGRPAESRPERPAPAQATGPVDSRGGTLDTDDADAVAGADPIPARRMRPSGWTPGGASSPTSGGAAQTRGAGPGEHPASESRPGPAAGRDTVEDRPGLVLGRNPSAGSAGGQRPEPPLPPSAFLTRRTGTPPPSSLSTVDGPSGVDPGRDRVDRQALSVDPGAEAEGVPARAPHPPVPTAPVPAVLTPAAPTPAAPTPAAPTPAAPTSPALASAAVPEAAGRADRPGTPGLRKAASAGSPAADTVLQTAQVPASSPGSGTGPPVVPDRWPVQVHPPGRVPPTVDRPQAVPLVRRVVPPGLPATPVPPVTAAVPELPSPVPTTLVDGFRRHYGVDVSAVPVWRGAAATAVVQQAGARAATRGGEVLLPASAGPLDAPPARALLAHELAHVVQQRAFGVAPPAESTGTGRDLEARALAAEHAFGDGAGLFHAGPPGPPPPVALLAGGAAAGIVPTPPGGAGTWGITPGGGLTWQAKPGAGGVPPASPAAGGVPPAATGGGGAPTGPPAAAHPLQRASVGTSAATLDDLRALVRGELDQQGTDQPAAVDPTPGVTALRAEVAAATAAPAIDRSTGRLAEVRNAVERLRAELRTVADREQATAARVDQDTARLRSWVGDRLPGRAVDLESPDDLEELAGRLYGRIRGRLRQELLVDRERSGRLIRFR